ncbi:hypothetical protein LIER_07991 [Lithospermum erythrorhizon]|uniref:RNase H type-1 domain-containing protein n=1 Tax=Lithospermum erythrorhizon TaxID=34254 RepID=A0AAV3PD16_LITER
MSCKPGPREDAKLVLAVPLSKHNIRDRLVWNHTSCGVYTTASGYLAARSMRINGDIGGRGRGATSSGDKDGVESAIGVACRYSGGSFLGAMFRSTGDLGSALLTEAMAIRDWMMFAKQQGWRTIEVENDSKKLIQILRGKIGIPLEVNIVITDILRWFISMEITFRFTQRENNDVARLVAHWNCVLEQEVSWLNVPPHWPHATLSKDCNS